MRSGVQTNRSLVAGWVIRVKPLGREFMDGGPLHHR